MKVAECKIDSLDLKILDIISKDARVPFRNVAELCGVSRAAIHMRVQHMIDMGVIVGSGYEVDKKRLGFSTCTYVGINFEKGSMYRDIVKQLEDIPEVVECSYTTGPYSVMIKLYARDNVHLMTLLTERIQEISGVMATETMISLDQSIRKEIPVTIEQ